MSPALSAPLKSPARKESEDLEYLASATLTRRREVEVVEEAAKPAPTRLFYLRKHADTDKLVEACTRKLAVNGQDVKALLIRAASYQKQGTYASALADYSAVVRLEPDNIEALYDRGTVFEKLAHLDAAVADFSRVLQLDAEHVRALYSRGACRNQKGEFAAALDDYARALELDKEARGKPRRRHSAHNARRPAHNASQGSLLRPLTAAVARGQTPAWSQPAAGGDNGVAYEAVALDTVQGQRDADGAGTILPDDMQFAARAGHSQDALLAGSQPSAAPRAHVDPSRAKPAADQALPVLPVKQQPGTQPLGADAQLVARLRSQGSIRQGSAIATAAMHAIEFQRAADIRKQEPGVLSEAEPPGASATSATTPAPALAGAQAAAGPASGMLRPAAASAGRSAVDSSGDLPAYVPPGSYPSEQPCRGSGASAADRHHAAGYALRKRGEYEAAVLEYDHALRLDHRHFRSMFNRAFCLDKEAQQCLWVSSSMASNATKAATPTPRRQLGRHKEALDGYSGAIALQPRNAFALYNRGITHDRLGDYAPAVRDFSAAILLDPSVADFYHNRGFSLRKQGDFEAALSDYSRAVSLAPDHARAFHNRASTLEQLGRWQEALDDYSAALLLDPRNAAALHNRGVLHERAGRLSEAEADLAAAVRLDASCAAAHAALAQVREALSGPRLALPAWDRAVYLEPGSASFRRGRALARCKCGDLAEALADFDQVLAEQPHDVACLTKRGYAHRKLGRYEAAFQDYSAALQAMPSDSVRLYVNRGYCAAQMGRYTDAVLDYSEALRLNPSSAHALQNRGGCYDKMGAHEKAVQDFTRALELEPNNTNALCNRASAYDSLGLPDMAVADFTRAHELDVAASAGGSL